MSIFYTPMCISAGLTAGLLLIAAISIVNTNVQPVEATILDKDKGASGFAPSEDPKAPGWDPSQAEEDAPGQEAEIPVPQPPVPGPPCEACAKDFAPGQEGLKEGIIGPPKVT